MQRDVGLENVQNLSSSVGKCGLAKEGHLAYETQAEASEVAALVVIADSTCTPLVEEGYKHASAGCLLDEGGELLEKIYLAEAPEEGKGRFWQRMDREVERLEQHMPDVPWYGISDGAVSAVIW